jgi:membrane associated rhomboid family serine protease
MGWEDRAYYRDKPQIRFGPMGGGLGKWSVVVWLILINAAIFLLDAMLTRAMGPVALQIGQSILPMQVLGAWGHFSVATTFENFQLWRLISFQFLHDGFFHLLGNTLGLFFFGPMVEQYWGSRRFLAFYLLCGVGGVLMYVLLWSVGLLVNSAWAPLVGASAGVFGILLVAARVAPRAKVLLFFIIPIELRYLLYGMIFIAVVYVVSAGDNAGGHAAHLGGLAAGLAFMTWPGLLAWAGDGEGPSLRQRVVQYQRDRQRKRDAVTDAEVDRILGKVRQEGLQSLSRREKRILQDATERQRRAG